MKSKSTVNFNVAIPPQVAVIVDLLAKKDNVNRAFIVREALYRYLAEHGVRLKVENPTGRGVRSDKMPKATAEFESVKVKELFDASKDTDSFKKILEMLIGSKGFKREKK